MHGGTRNVTKPAQECPEAHGLTGIVMTTMTQQLEVATDDGHGRRRGGGPLALPRPPATEHPLRSCRQCMRSLSCPSCWDIRNTGNWSSRVAQAETAPVEPVKEPELDEEEKEKRRLQEEEQRRQEEIVSSNLLGCCSSCNICMNCRLPSKNSLKR